MPKMPNRHFAGIQNGIVGKYYSILAQLMPATDDGNAETGRLFGREESVGLKTAKVAEVHSGKVDYV